MSEGGFRRGCLIAIGVCGMLFLGLVGLLISVCGGGLFQGHGGELLVAALVAVLGTCLIWVIAAATSPRRNSDKKPEN